MKHFKGTPLPAIAGGAEARRALVTRAGLLAAALLVTAAPALSDSAAIEQCRRIDDAAQRLACYDAIRLTPEARAADAAPPPSTVAPAASVATVSASTSTKTPPTRDAAASFGLPQTANPQSVDAIESTVGPMFDGWRPRDRIRLGNGQVWEVVDEMSGTIEPKPIIKVRIKRGLFGGYVMEFEGSNRWVRVRRLQ